MTYTHDDAMRDLDDIYFLLDDPQADGGAQRNRLAAYIEKLEAEKELYKSFRDSAESTIEKFKRLSEQALPIINGELSLAEDYEIALATERENFLVMFDEQKQVITELRAALVIQRKRTEWLAEKYADARVELREAYHMKPPHEHNALKLDILDAAREAVTKGE